MNPNRHYVALLPRLGRQVLAALGDFLYIPFMASFILFGKA